MFINNGYVIVPSTRTKGKCDDGSQSLERGQYSANSAPCGRVGGLAGAPPGGQPGSSCPWQHCWESDICMYLGLGLGVLIYKWKRMEMTFMGAYYFS